MILKPYWICHECHHIASMQEPSTRWGKLPPCPKCGALFWQKVKELWDYLEDNTPYRERGSDE